MVEKLALDARPPTPPRASSRSELLDHARHRPGSADILPGTPDDSHARLTSSQPEPGSKRVVFSPIPQYIKPLLFTKTQSKSPLRFLRPSNECKPAKSILKASAPPLPPSPSDPLQPNELENLATMWESAVQQLSGESRNFRLDAYMHLFGALKAYDGLSDENGVAEKIGLTTQFIQRDIRQESGEYETLDINLVTYALKLLTVLVWNPQLSIHLPDEFRAFVIDRATTALQETKTPKSIVSHYMHLLSTQTFQQKIMTGNRASKLLNILQNITDRVNGNAVIAQRLMIYQRLLTQSKTSMATHANLWVQHLLTGLFHHIKDTRNKAVALGLQAATTFGSNASVSTAVRASLNAPLEDDGRIYLSEVIGNLTRMISSREKGLHVPQIWSIVILLVRNRKSSVEQWEHFKEWLLVIQKCFNCSDSAIKTQATLAWNRFVYAVSPSESTGISMVRMLSKPILSQIERRKIEKLGTQANSTAFSSYCNLLYYAFRPSASHKQLDIFWKEYVLPPFSTIFNSGPTINDRASQILSSLLWNPQLKIWRENRANEATKLEPNELPVIDCRWVRSRVSTVLEVFESLFTTSLWREDDLHQSSIALAWTSFAKALGEASSKEIKPTTESMHAIASILGMFQRLWKRGPAALNDGHDSGDDAFLNRFCFLSKTIVSSLGPIPFTENLLLKPSSQGAFQTINTPTHRRPFSDGSCKTPILHFLHLISSLPTGVTPGLAYRSLISEIIGACTHARSSRGSRLELFRQFVELHLHNASNDLDLGSYSARYIWEVTADLVDESLVSPTPDTTRDRGNALSRDHVNIVLNILDAGIRFEESHSDWSRLAESLVDVVRTERKEDSVAAIIIEPLSESLLNKDVAIALSPTETLLKLAIYPSMQINEPHSPRLPNFNPYLSSQVNRNEIGYEKLMDLTEKALRESYQQYTVIFPTTLSTFIEAVVYSLHSCPSNVRTIALERLQTGVSLWLADRDHQLGKDPIDDRKIMATVRKLSTDVASILENLTEHDSQQLERFQGLISSGLETFHKSIANTFIIMWNNTFGSQIHLKYPESVELALRKLEPFVDLQLPSFPRAANLEEGEPSPPEFLSSQEDLTNRATQIKSFDQHKLVSSPLNLVSSSRANSSSPAYQSGNKSTNLIEHHPATTPKSRRRHDDSQVEFVAVGSSSPIEHEPVSQYLTEHQKDVRERQRNETAMFPEFKSSSPAVGRLTPGKLRGESGLRTEIGRNPSSDTPDDAPMTPTIAATTAENEEEFPVSSPTPTSQNPGSLPNGVFAEPSSCRTNEDVDMLKPLDPPSSPPDSQSHRLDTEAASKAAESPPEVESGSQEPQNQDRGSTSKERAPSSQSAFDDTEEEERESAREYESQEMFQQAEELTGSGNKEVAGTAEPAEQSTQPPLAESTPDLTRVDFSETADHGTPSPSKATRQVDTIPDSFVSDVDSQVASQLDQELAGVLGRKEKEKEETPKKLKLSGVSKRAKKRRRQREAREAPDSADLPSPKRIRTRSLELRSHSKVDDDKGLKGRKAKTSNSAPKTAINPDQSKTESHAHTPVSEAGTRRTRAQVQESRTPATKKRNRAPENEGESEPRVTDSMLNPPSSKKRRSSRLSGESAVLNVRDDGSIPGRKKRTIRNKSQESVQATPQPLQPELETQDIMSQRDDGRGDVDVVDSDNNMKVSAPTPVAPQLVSQGTQTDTPEDREVEASEAGILGSLRRVLSAIRTVTWGRPALREIDDVMFDIRVEAHDANRRHGE